MKAKNSSAELQLQSQTTSVIPTQSSVQSKLFIQDLIDKINNQSKFIIQQKQETEKFHDSQVKLDDYMQLQNFQKMGLYNKDKFGESQEKSEVKEDEANEDETWLMYNMLKIERIRQRV